MTNKRESNQYKRDKRITVLLTAPFKSSTRVSVYTLRNVRS